MAKLYFKYGAMGSSKTAQALITKFNYEERGHKVLLVKPATDDRDGATVIKSRIGLYSEAFVIADEVGAIKKKLSEEKASVLIVDECQFLSKEQVLEIRNIVSEFDIPVLCFGLRTDFSGELFEGSKALFALADSIAEIKSICDCGNKAIVNARIDKSGKIIANGPQVLIGGNESYKPMCWKCWWENR